MKLLMVEDDVILGDGLKAILAMEGYSVEWVRDGWAADTALKSDVYDLVLLDLNLPGRSGLEVLKHLRTRGNKSPVMVVTARGQVEDRVRALDDGADDYVIKPFDPDELCARLRALHRRAVGGDTAALLRHGNLLVDPDAHTVSMNGEPVSLSPKEFALLITLLENAGKVLSRQRLEQSLYGWGDEVESNAVEVYIHYLRKKLNPDLIRTIRGVGYIIERPR